MLSFIAGKRMLAAWYTVFVLLDHQHLNSPGPDRAVRGSMVIALYIKSSAGGSPIMTLT
jgi:hypothetical protein